MYKVLFVCTGNIFRSLTAEHALKKMIGADKRFFVSSAGTLDSPNLTVRKDVREYLLSKGFDVRTHMRQTVCKKLIDDSDLVIAMSVDHQRFLQDNFNLGAPLFTEACGEIAAPILDVDEVLPDTELHGLAARTHIQLVINSICALTPMLAERLTTSLATPKSRIPICRG